MSLQIVSDNFIELIRLFNTNIDGKRKVPFALRQIKGIGIRFAYVICKRANIDAQRRAGTLSPEEMERIRVIMESPKDHNIPDWFLNRQRDPVKGTASHLYGGDINARLREDLERLKKMRAHRGIRHAFGLRVRGQHTCTSGRHGKTMGVSKKK